MNYSILYNQSLKRYNTLKIESKAHAIAFPFNCEGVQDIYRNYKERKIVVIGRGSNILLSKEYYSEEYLFLNLKLMDNIEISRNKILCEAGTSLSELAWYTVENNIQGFEFLEDIPGTIGGAVIMNAGTYEDNISKLIDKITYYDIDKDIIITEEVTYENFGRRSSKWSSGNYVVISCEFKALQGDYLKSLDKLLEVKKQRYLKQPRNYPNAGSVFKRPVVNGEELQVWKLVNDAGLSGLKTNDAMISDKHTGFIINAGNATYQDLVHLIDLIKQTIKEKYDVNLELEWKII